MKNEYINIIGAGPAGLTAAIVLRKKGFLVRVFEKVPDVGHRLHGDFQGLENWSSDRDITDLLKEIGIRINFLCVPHFGGTIYAPGMKPLEVRSDRPVFYLVRRGPMPGTLDTGLKEQALSLGIEIHFNHRIDVFDGKAIVGTGPKKAVGITSGITFSTSHNDMVVMVFDNGIAPAGYAYLIVHQGRGTMVTVLYREFRRIDHFFDRMVHFFKENIDINIRDEKRFRGYGDFFISETLVRNGKLFIGEAGGFQDYLWGFGMRYAILSGRLAAESLVNGSDYDRLWKKELKPMMETSLVNRYLFEKCGHAGYRYIAGKSAHGNVFEFLKKNYNPSPLKRLLLPLAKRSYRSRMKSNGFDYERLLIKRGQGEHA